MLSSRPRRFTALLMLPLALAAVAGSARADDEPAKRHEVEPPNPRWLDRMDDADRAILESNVGYAPPAFTVDLEWVKAPPRDWSKLRGKVVVVHSWSSGSSAGRSVPQRLEKLVEEVETDDLVVLAVHTPEDLDALDRFLELREPGVPLVIDESGRFCDELGFYKRPTNVVIDRSGLVRFVGVRASALPVAVESLLQEKPRTNIDPQPRPKADAKPTGDAKFPEFTNSTGSVPDHRGNRGPAFFVQNWMTPQPDARNKVVVVEFWATWCGPCRKSIPHLTELQHGFGDELVVVGVSNEEPGTVQQFMRSNRMGYSVAVDQTGKMQSAVGVRGIPHALVMSADWIVRWQGHPSSLTKQDLGRIIEANRQLVGSEGSTPNRYRWTGEKSGR